MPSELPVWQQGRLDGRRGPARILFGQTYEDPEIELRAFPPGRVMCIASAGCTARALAERHAVDAVDINPVQLAYAQRRLAGAPAELGSAERLMGALRSLLPLAGIRRRDWDDFVRLPTPSTQQERWKELVTRRFSWGLACLFSLVALRRVYAQDLLSPLPPRFGRVLLSRLERGFAAHPNATNPYAAALLLGTTPGIFTPPPHPIELHCADAASYLESCPPAALSGVSLSNILDGAPSAYRQRLARAVRHATTPNGVVVWRSFGEPTTAEQARLAAADRSLLWGIVEALPAQEFR